MLNGDAHHSTEVEAELRISRCRFFKQNMGIISEWGVPIHHPPASHHILYVGRTRTLPDHLNHILADSFTVRCPDALLARIFLRSDLPYALLLLDAKLPDATGRELAHFARTLPHRTRTSTLILPPGTHDLDALVGTIARLLTDPIN